MIECERKRFGSKSINNNNNNNGREKRQQFQTDKIGYLLDSNCFVSATKFEIIICQACHLSTSNSNIIFFHAAIESKRKNIAVILNRARA